MPAYELQVDLPCLMNDFGRLAGLQVPALGTLRAALLQGLLATVFGGAW